MGLIIVSSGLAERISLTLKDTHVVHAEALVTTRRKKIPYGDIDYILLSDTDHLSIQSGNEVVSIQIKPKKKKHMKVFDELVRRTRETLQ